MEEFKSLDQILQIDERHLLLGQVTGRLHSLESLHASLAAIDLHPDVPEDVRGQFNVARNMALYTLFHYAMAPEVQMKTFSVIELGLKRRLPEAEGRGLAGLLKAAIARNLLSDAGVKRHPELTPWRHAELTPVKVEHWAWVPQRPSAEGRCGVLRAAGSCRRGS